jgi:putative hydrolase of the HAD superfamily
MIRALVFDIGNVLLRFDITRALDRVRAYCKAPILIDAIEPVKGAYEEGRLSNDEFCQRLVALLQYTGTLDDLISAWEEIFTENSAMTDLARRLHAHYPMFLLSNTSDLHIGYMFRTYPVFGLFQDAVYSCRVGLSKPNPMIFETAVRQFGVKPGETLYIDDLEPNVLAARAHGFHAFLYDHENHAAFEAELDRLGVRR